MKTTTARLALPALATLLALPLGGCKLPYQILSKLVAPKPTPTPTPPPAKPVAAEYLEIRDERARGEGLGATATVSVEIPSMKNGDVAAARVVPTRIVDDLGTSLLPEKPEEAYFESPRGDAGQPLVLVVKMKNAPRKAKLLKEVTADAELYTPALDPSALVTIPKFLGEAGKPVVNPVLKAAGVEIAILSPAQVEAEWKAYGEKKRAEAKAMGIDAEAVDRVVKIEEESFLGSSWVHAWLKVTDPNGRVHDYVFVYSSGVVEGANLSNEHGFVGLSAQGGEAGPDWGLQVRLRTPKTHQRVTFTVRDVELP